MHCNLQIANAAKAALDALPDFAGRGGLARMRPAAREKMPVWSVYCLRSRNRIDHQMDGAGQLVPVLRREIELDARVWLAASTGLTEAVAGLQAQAEAALCASSGLKALVHDGLVWPVTSDVRIDEEDRDIAVLAMVFAASVFTPVDDPELILV